jgi:hypothetical protein
MMSSKRSASISTQGVAHALAFHLEHADRLAALQQLVGLLVVERQRREVDLDALRLQEVDGAAAPSAS